MNGHTKIVYEMAFDFAKTSRLRGIQEKFHDYRTMQMSLQDFCYLFECCNLQSKLVQIHRHAINKYYRVSNIFFNRGVAKNVKH